MYACTQDFDNVSGEPKVHAELLGIIVNAKPNAMLIISICREQITSKDR